MTYPPTGISAPGASTGVQRMATVEAPVVPSGRVGQGLAGR
jgi:hypothetical protein